jgi:sulfur-carrier protein adenylyltransferase/sulfurtransferase
MKEITVQELKKKMDAGNSFQLIDVRESHERAYTNIGGDHIPMGRVMQSIDKIDREKEVIVYCRSGSRSAQVVSFLEEQHGFNNLFNLKGGILAWSTEIDSAIRQY